MYREESVERPVSKSPMIASLPMLVSLRRPFTDDGEEEVGT